MALQRMEYRARSQTPNSGDEEDGDHDRVDPGRGVVLGRVHGVVRRQEQREEQRAEKMAVNIDYECECGLHKV